MKLTLKMGTKKQMTIRQENQIPVETTPIVETNQQQPPLTLTPPSKADILIDLYRERERLKLLRTEVTEGLRRPSKKLSTELYVTQLVMQANKTMLYALKENNINITQNTNVDISQQVNELIKISREIEKCKQHKSQPSATS